MTLKLWMLKQTGRRQGLTLMWKSQELATNCTVRWTRHPAHVLPEGCSLFHASASISHIHGADQGQKSLVGYSPWGCKELGMTEQQTLTYTKIWWFISGFSIMSPFTKFLLPCPFIPVLATCINTLLQGPLDQVSENLGIKPTLFKKIHIMKL